MSTWEITIDSTTWEISVDSSVTINTPFTITSVAITPGSVTQIDTGQTLRKPRAVTFYDEVQDKNIDHSLPGWTARQDDSESNWFIDIPSQLITYTNITISWQ